jgi:phosphoribosylcarboxyaminoimidazole (NCAIR) mutase
VRTSTARLSVIWLLGSAAGAAVIALPDSGNRVFSFSATHGPSPLDLAGMVALFAAWLPVLGVLVRERRLLRGHPVELSVVILAVAALTATIRLDAGAWWLVPVAVLVGVQLLLLKKIDLARRASR